MPGLQRSDSSGSNCMTVRSWMVLVAPRSPETMLWVTCMPTPTLSRSGSLRHALTDAEAQLPPE